MRQSAVMRGTKLRVDSRAPHPNPPLAEIEALLATIDAGRDHVRAAASLGISQHTLRRQLDSLNVRLGAESRIEAVRILWPIIADAVTINGRTIVARPERRNERRLGVERRQSIAWPRAIAAAAMAMLLAACSSSAATSSQPPVDPTATPAPGRVRYAVGFEEKLAQAGTYLVISVECSDPPHGYDDVAAFCDSAQLDVVDQATSNRVQPGDEWPLPPESPAP